jgi:hypothetical protein
MAAGLVYHNITTAAGVTFTVAKWVPDTTVPNVGALPIHVLLKSDGTPMDFGAGTGGSGTQRFIQDSSQLATIATIAKTRADGFQLTDQPTDGTLVTKGLSNRAVDAAFSTLTRPANTTPYSVGDSISDNATAGSVTAIVATVSDTNDDPVIITEIKIDSTDTGLAGKRIRAYLFNSDPTALSGVGAGDNVGYANKKAGYVGSFAGKLETGFSDGTVGRLVPTFNDSADTTNLGGLPAGGFVVAKPASGAKTFWVQFQTLDAFTPSAISTTIIAKIKGLQARAA